MIRYLNLVVLVLAFGCIESSTKKDNIINRKNNKKMLEHKKKIKDYNKNIFTKYTYDNFLISLQYKDSCICIENSFLFEIYNSQYKNEITYFEFYKFIQSNKIKINWREHGVTRIYANSSNFDNMSIDEITLNYLTHIDKSRYVLDTVLTDEETCNLIKKMSANFYYIKQSDYSGALYFNKTITYPPRAPLKRK